MSRFLILFLFLIWTAWPGVAQLPARLPWRETSLFLGIFAVIVLLLGLWSRMLARRVTGANPHGSLLRFNKALFAARSLIPIWFGVGVFVLDWGVIVQYLLGPLDRWPVQLPGAALGTLPPVLAWVGLWWSQYPADRALREQSMLINLDDGLPLHAPPTFWEYVRANVRLQLLFTVVPVALILFTRDALVMVLWKTRWAGLSDVTDAVISLSSALLVLLLAPEILRRVLHTQPLPPSPLRERLEAICRRSKLRYRDILLWRTENNMGNAAVMGLLPRVRYILLSDLLLESMRDEQIEAVFAHEVGHVVHRHMGWYVVFFVILTLAGWGATATLVNHFGWLALPAWLPPGLLMTAMGTAAFLVSFGFLSRRFERQADVFAARTVEMLGATTTQPLGGGTAPAAAAAAPAAATPWHVGPYGANVFASALHRVAVINNIPVAPRRARGGGAGTARQRLAALADAFVEGTNNWLHGSISNRMQYVHHLAADPAHTTRFDRFMGRLYVALVLALVACGAWVFVAR